MWFIDPKTVTDEHRATICRRLVNQLPGLVEALDQDRAESEVIEGFGVLVDMLGTEAPLALACQLHDEIMRVHLHGTGLASLRCRQAAVALVRHHGAA